MEVGQEGWGGVDVEPLGVCSTLGSLARKWLGIILWVVYACLAYHSCDMFVCLCGGGLF